MSEGDSGVGPLRAYWHALSTGLTYFLLSFIGLVMCFPLLWMISTSLKAPGMEFVFPPQLIPTVPRWQNYVEIWAAGPFAVYGLNSVTVTVIATVGTALSASLVAFGFAWLRFPGKQMLFGLMLATMMLPGIVTLIPTFIMFKTFNWIDTFLPLTVPYWFGGAFYIFLMRQYYLGLPYELIEAARVDGAGYLRIYWRIMLPLAGPALAAVCVFSFVHHWNDFLHPLIYINSTQLRTLALGLRYFLGEAGTDSRFLMTASVLMLIPELVVFLSAQRYFIRGVQLSGLAGR